MAFDHLPVYSEFIMNVLRDVYDGEQNVQHSFLERLCEMVTRGLSWPIRDSCVALEVQLDRAMCNSGRRPPTLSYIVSATLTESQNPPFEAVT